MFVAILDYLIKNKHKIEHKILYIGLADLIKETIQQEIIKSGDMLPTEAILEENLQISRVTIRKALKLLEQQGAITRRQGQGTFVSKYKTFNLSTSFTDDIKKAQQTPSEHRLAYLSITLPEDICQKLDCPPNTTGHYLKRVRFIDEHPILVEEKWIPHTICPKECIIGVSLYQTLSELNALPVTFKRQIFSAIASDENCELLQIEEGAPVLILLQTGYRFDKTPVEYGKVICQQINFV